MYTILVKRCKHNRAPARQNRHGSSVMLFLNSTYGVVQFNSAKVSEALLGSLEKESFVGAKHIASF